MTWHSVLAEPLASIPADNTRKRHEVTSQNIPYDVRNGEEPIEHVFEMPLFNREDKEKRIVAGRFASFSKWMFIYVGVTSTGIMWFYVLPFAYRDADASSLLHQRLLVLFIYFQTCLNWYFTRHRPAVFTHTPTKIPATSPRSLDWSYCQSCQTYSPPRCHHCRVCDVCVLKRDHHCYMTGVCVGHTNQRYFIVLVSYITLSLTYLPLLYQYLAEGQHGYQFETWDFILPVTVYRFVFASLPMHLFIIITFLYGGWFVLILGPGFLLNQLFIIVKGKTTHELKKKARVRCLASVNQRFREVFGPFWLLNWLVPMHFLVDQDSDGVMWDNYIKSDYMGTLKNV